MVENEQSNSPEGAGVEIKEGEFGQIELPRLDVSQYVGRKSKIESVQKSEGMYGPLVKIFTETIDTLNNGQELKASKLFGLQTDTEGKVGWGPDTKLGMFLKKKGVSDLTQLKGIEVTVQTITGKDGNDYLTFN